jgi:hypothetical protein
MPSDRELSDQKTFFMMLHEQQTWIPEGYCRPVGFNFLFADGVLVGRFTWIKVECTLVPFVIAFLINSIAESDDRLIDQEIVMIGNQGVCI